MEFKSKMVNGKPQIEPVVERKKNAQGGYDVVVHVPSLELINEFKERNQDGERNLQ